MARSYKSALPTWTTYTPYTGPMGVQSAINAPDVYGIKARQWIGSNSSGYFSHIAQSAVNQARGTGAGEATLAAFQHRPLMTLARNKVEQRYREGQSGWHGAMMQAVTNPALPPPPGVPLGAAPAAAVAAGRAGAVAPTPQTVNPSSVAVKNAATATGTALAGAAVQSSTMGTSNAPAASNLNSLWLPPRRGK